MEIIRYGSPRDLAALARLEAASYPPAEGASEERIRQRLAVFPDCFWILERDGKILSFVNGMSTDLRDLTDEMYENPALHCPKGPWQMIFSVVTDPDQRRQGLAGRVLTQVISDCRSRGQAGIVLTCKETLLPFYGAFGFVSEGVSGSAHGGAVWYQMRLRL